MDLVGEKLASGAMLDKGLCGCSGHRPIKTWTESLDYKGSSCSVVTAEPSMNFSQELPPFLLGDTSLKYSGSAFLIKLSLMDFVGFGYPHYAACLILILEEFLPSKVGEEWFCPRGDDGHYYVG